MSPISRHLMTLVLAGGLLSSTGFAQEQFAPDLVLRKTSIKTADNVVFPDILGGPTPLFTTTTVTCPNGGTCTVRVELSALLETRGNLVAANVLVDQEPTHSVPLPITAGTQTAPASFAWTVQGLTPGDHTIEVLAWRYFFNNEEPRVKLRTLTISVYKP